MKIRVFVLACLAYGTFGRRVQAAIERLQRRPVSKKQSDTLDPSNILATLLLALKQPSGFDPSSLSVHFSRGEVPAQSWSRLGHAPRMQGALVPVRKQRKQNKLTTRLRQELMTRETDDVAGMIAYRSKVKKATMAIIGRPNTGKSAIANRITQKFHKGSIVWDLAGVTRDRTYGEGWWNGYEFKVVDTGGLIFEDIEGEVFLPQIREQAMAAVNEARVVILVVDGKVGPTGFDEEIANWGRKQGKPILLAVNKCDGQQHDMFIADWWSFGLGTPFPVSGIHGTGLGELLDEAVKHLPEPPEQGYGGVLPLLRRNEDRESEDGSEDEVANEIREINVAIIGKPNTGKSTLLNTMTRTDRAIVSDVAGTTRDAIDASVTYHGVKFTFVDTAGVRKRTKLKKNDIEEEMVKRALRAARRADICVLVLDATNEHPADQENRLARFISHAGRGCVTIVNKWDTVPDKSDKLYRNQKTIIDSYLMEIQWAKKVFVSAKTGLRTNTIFDAVLAADHEHSRRIKTAVFNEVLEEGVRWQKPPSTAGGRQGTIYYGAQVGVRPPTFIIFCNDPKLFSVNYRRYLERHIRKSLGFEGTALNIYFKKSASRRTPGIQGR